MKYLESLKKIKDIEVGNQRHVGIFELNGDFEDNTINSWANHFRQQYCPDNIIDALISGTGMGREEFLKKMKLPDKSEDFGPATRSGDFAELLISDYLEYLLNYYVPKERYQNKFNRNTSSQGTDVIGLKMFSRDDSKDDELVVFEVKAQTSGKKPKNRLQDAINDSQKDCLRKAETLSAIKQRMIERGDMEHVKLVERFQNKADRPYKEYYGAAAVHAADTYSEEMISKVTELGETSWLIVITRDNLMDLVHELYGRAAKC
ncbi:MAG: Hachiman antiphage defense system protein HamA [Lachnospiraceae bacterium]